MGGRGGGGGAVLVVQHMTNCGEGKRINKLDATPPHNQRGILLISIKSGDKEGPQSISCGLQVCRGNQWRGRRDGRPPADMRTRLIGKCASKIKLSPETLENVVPAALSLSPRKAFCLFSGSSRAQRESPTLDGGSCCSTEGWP